MSISQNFPDEGPTLNLNFAGSKVLDPRITFSRSSVGTYMDDSGLIVTAPADAPRFDHRYVNGEIESLGLLVEEQRTNLVNDSNGGDYGYDMSSGGSPTNDIAPDGSTVACKYDLSSVTGSPFLNCNVDTTLTDDVTYTMSMWVKGTTEFTVALAFVGETNYTVTSRNMNVTTSWTRETYTFTLSGNQTNSRLQVFFGTQGQGKIISIWGAQLEEGGFATSYIHRSAGSQSTRVHDRAYYENVDQTDWFNKTEGTVVFEHTDVPYDSSDDPHYPAVGFAETTGGGSNPSIQYFIMKHNGNSQYLVRPGGGDSANISPSGVVASASKVGFVYKANDYALVRNGSLVGTDTSGAVPDAYMLIFGMNDITNPTNNWNAHIKHFSYYPTRLGNNILQTLTK
jgi:hypothetical protein